MFNQKIHIVNTNTAEKTNFSFLNKVHDVTRDQLNVLNMMMIKTPDQIGAFIDIWTKAKESSNGDVDFIKRCEDNISKGYDALEKMMKITQLIINLPDGEEITETKETTTAVQTAKPPVAEKQKETKSETKPAPMTVAKTDEELATLYDQHAGLTTEEINAILKTMPQLDAIEMGVYLFSNGKYKAKSPKKQPATVVRDRINKMFEGTKKSDELNDLEKAEYEDMKDRIYEKLTIDNGTGTASLGINHEELYKDHIGKITLDGIALEYKKLVEKHNVEGAIDFVTYMLSKKKYVGALPEQNWSIEDIQNFMDMAIEGSSSNIKGIEEAVIVEDDSTKNSSASAALESTGSQMEDSSATQKAADAEKQTVTPAEYDIRYNDVVLFIDSECKAEGATEETVKESLKKFLSTNIEKKIEKVDFDIASEDGGFDTFWNKNFSWVSKKLEAMANKKARLEAEAVAEADKEQIITKIGGDLVLANKEKISDGSYGLNKLAGDIKKLSFQSNVKMKITEAMGYARKFLNAAGLTIADKKSTVPKEEPKSEKAVETKTAEETTTIVDTNNTTGTGISELEGELGDKSYFEDIISFYKKYENTEKKEIAVEVIVKAFTNSKVFEKASDEKPTVLSLPEIENFLNTQKETKEEVKEEKPSEDTTSKESKEDKKETDNSTTINPFFKAKNKEEFNTAVTTMVKELKADSSRTISDITSKVKESITEAKRTKGSYVRSQYKHSKDPDIYKAINSICVSANIEGFMNS